MVTIVVMLVMFAGAAIGAGQDRPASGGSLAGAWRLDPNLSDHPEQVALALRINTGEITQQDFFAVMGARGSSGRGGRGGAAQAGRGGQQSEGSKEDSDDTDRKILAELTEAVRVPPLTLTISQEEDWTITPGLKATDVVRTSSKAEKYTLAAGTIERTATRQGPNLVIEYDADDAGILTCAYALAPTTGQLVVRITFERRRGEPGPFVIKFVYNRAAPVGAGG